MRTRTRLAAIAAATGMLLAGAFAQDAVPGDGPITFESDHFTVEYPATLDGAETLFVALEAIRSAIDEVFLFGADDKPSSVVVCADKAAFDAYVSDLIGETRNQCVFLKYADPALSRLVLFPAAGKTGYAAFAGPALNRQVFLQYLYSHVSEPPLWLRDGFQAYFENLSFEEKTGKVTTGAYSPWLETAKNLAADPERAISPSDILAALPARYETSAFYPQAWSLVRFFLMTEKPEYQRFLHEAFVLLDPPGGDGYNTDAQGVNTALVAARFDRIVDSQRALTDFNSWLSSRSTYSQMLQAGMDSYSSGSYDTARASFAEAYTVHPEDPMLLYYRGLVEYAAKDYSSADGWYRMALQAGAEVSTVNWALGLNAIADGRNGEARVYLETAKSANSARYGEKADKLLNSLPK